VGSRRGSAAHTQIGAVNSDSAGRAGGLRTATRRHGGRQPVFTPRSSCRRSRARRPTFEVGVQREGSGDGAGDGHHREGEEPRRRDSRLAASVVVSSPSGPLRDVQPGDGRRLRNREDVDMTVLTAKGLWKLVTLELPCRTWGRSRSRPKGASASRGARLPRPHHRGHQREPRRPQLCRCPCWTAAICCSLRHRGGPGPARVAPKREAAPAARAGSSAALDGFAIYNDLAGSDAFKIFR